MIETFFQMTVASGEFLADEIGEKLNAIGVKTEWLECFGKKVLLVDLDTYCGNRDTVYRILSDYIDEKLHMRLRVLVTNDDFIMIKEAEDV